MRILVDRGRATGVTTADGERYAARRAVIADVAAPHLYGGLVPDEELPPRTVRAMRRFQLDPSTVKVDWALDGPVPWASPPPHAPGTVHVADSVEQMTEALGQVSAGAIPAEPFLLTGQMTTADPTRSPTGTEALWAYTHVPQRSHRDAGEGGIRGVWDRDDCERFADRMQARIERYAPGLREPGPRPSGPGAPRDGGQGRQPDRRRPQRRHLPAAPGADLPSGPGPGSRRDAHRGPLPRVGLRPPGGGVHGAPGMNAARAAILHARLRAVRPGRR